MIKEPALEKLKKRFDEVKRGNEAIFCKPLAYSMSYFLMNPDEIFKFHTLTQVNRTIILPSVEDVLKDIVMPATTRAEITDFLFNFKKTLTELGDLAPIYHITDIIGDLYMKGDAAAEQSSKILYSTGGIVKINKLSSRLYETGLKTFEDKTFAKYRETPNEYLKIFLIFMKFFDPNVIKMEWEDKRLPGVVNDNYHTITRKLLHDIEKHGANLSLNIVDLKSLFNCMLVRGRNKHFKVSELTYRLLLLHLSRKLLSKNSYTALFRTLKLKREVPWLVVK